MLDRSVQLQFLSEVLVDQHYKHIIFCFYFCTYTGYICYVRLQYTSHPCQLRFAMTITVIQLRYSFQQHNS